MTKTKTISVKVKGNEVVFCLTRKQKNNVTLRYQLIFLLNWETEMIKNWIQKALDFLSHSLNPIPQELNELDWKEDLWPDNAKLCQHLSVFANQPGGGFMVFGIEDKPFRLVGVTQQSAEKIVQRLGSLCRDSLESIKGTG